MTKAIALLALVSIQILSMLGNIWFTYGLWPRSWASFVVFGIAHLLIVLAIRAINREME